jgi:hypothetical protein
MTNDRAFELTLIDWLNAGSDRTRPDTLDHVLATVARTPQDHVLIPAWSRPRARARWWLIAAAMLILTAAGGLAFSQGQKTTPIHSPSPAASASATLPLESPAQPVAIGGGVAPCIDGGPPVGAGHLARPVPDPALTAPAGMRLAVRVDTPGGGGSLVLAPGGGAPNALLATWAGAGWDTAILGATDDDSQLLLWIGRSGGPDPRLDCSNLFLVATDGTAIERVTDNEAGTGISGAAVSGDGTEIAAVTIDSTDQLGLVGVVKHLDVFDGTGNLLMSMPCGGDWTGYPRDNQLAFSPDGALLAERVCGGGLGIVNVAGRPTSLRTYPQWMDALRWTTDGSAVIGVSGGLDGKLGVYQVVIADGKTSRLLRTTIPRDWISCCPVPVLSRDGRWVLAADGSVYPQVVNVVDAHDGEARELRGWSDLLPLFFEPDGRTVLFGRYLEDHTVYELAEQDLMTAGQPRSLERVSSSTWFAWSAPQ